MDCRGFDGLEEMNEYMIKQWNNKVRKNDEVVVLGDLALSDGESVNKLLSRLNGKIFLIEGNHDKRYLKDKRFNRKRFIWIKDYAEMSDDGTKVILCHYPIPFYNGQYRTKSNSEPKTYMLYGHVHDTEDQKLMEKFIDITRDTVKKDGSKIPSNMINCFCMYSDYVPLTLKEWIELNNERKKKT
jgi:calcineurin-like phosphoesterase family protein